MRRTSGAIFTGQLKILHSCAYVRPRILSDSRRSKMQGLLSLPQTIAEADSVLISGCLKLISIFLQSCRCPVSGGDSNFSPGNDDNALRGWGLLLLFPWQGVGWTTTSVCDNQVLNWANFTIHRTASWTSGHLLNGDGVLWWGHSSTDLREQVWVNPIPCWVA